MYNPCNQGYSSEFMCYASTLLGSSQSLISEHEGRKQLGDLKTTFFSMTQNVLSLGAGLY